MARRGRSTGWYRNNYQHKIHAKVGTKALTLIYVDMKTYRDKHAGRLVPGVKIKFRMSDYVGSDLLTGIVANETVPGGTLFITLQ